MKINSEPGRVCGQSLRTGIAITLATAIAFSASGWYEPHEALVEKRSEKKATSAPRDAREPSVADGEYLTTNQGLRMADDDNSLKAGARGPTLMEDFHFREKAFIVVAEVKGQLIQHSILHNP